MLWSTAVAGGNPLGRTECSDASSGCAPLQCLMAWDWISGSDGEGPHSAHRVTPRTSSAVTRRKGTCNVTKKKKMKSPDGGGLLVIFEHGSVVANIRRKQNQVRQKDSTQYVSRLRVCKPRQPLQYTYVLDFSSFLNGEEIYSDRKACYNIVYTLYYNEFR